MKFSGIVPNLPIYHFWSFWDFLSSTFWEMVEKPPKNTVFLKLLNDQIFYGKSGSAVTFSLSSSNFWPKIRKIHRQEVWKLDGIQTIHNLSCGLTVGENCSLPQEASISPTNLMKQVDSYWLPNGVEPLALSRYAVSSKFKHSKSRK